MYEVQFGAGGDGQVVYLEMLIGGQVTRIDKLADHAPTP
jgi:hypothetical protein